MIVRPASHGETFSFPDSVEEVALVLRSHSNRTYDVMSWVSASSAVPIFSFLYSSFGLSQHPPIFHAPGDPSVSVSVDPITFKNSVAQLSLSDILKRDIIAGLEAKGSASDDCLIVQGVPEIYFNACSDFQFREYWRLGAMILCVMDSKEDVPVPQPLLPVQATPEVNMHVLCAPFVQLTAIPSFHQEITQFALSSGEQFVTVNGNQAMALLRYHFCYVSAANPLPMDRESIWRVNVTGTSFGVKGYPALGVIGKSPAPEVEHSCYSQNFYGWKSIGVSCVGGIDHFGSDEWSGYGDEDELFFR